MDKRSFENYFNVLNKLADSGRILWKVHYDTYIDQRGSYVLRLNYRKFMTRLIEYYSSAAVAHMLENMDLAKDMKELQKHFESYEDYISPSWLEADSFRKELRAKAYCIDSSYPVMFYHEENLRERSMYRSAIIDINKLQSEGVVIEKLLSDNRKVEGQGR